MNSFTSRDDAVSDDDAAPLVRACHHEPAGTVRIELTGELDLLTAEQFTSAVRAQLADSPITVVIDMTDVSFVDSTGIGTLLAGRRVCTAAGATFMVIPSPNVERVTRLLGVHDVLTAGSDSPDAIG